MTDTPRTRRRLTDAPAGGPEPWAPSGRIDGLVRLGGRVRAAVVASWVVVLFLILRHTIFLSLDTVSNYVHVWWVGDNLRAGHGIPFHMPVIGHGQALAFPYGFVPWLTAGLLWPVLGDWVVTLWIALGFVLVVTAMFWALPEIRRGWWAAAALLNPMLVLAPIVGQLPFLWAIAFLFAAIGCWRRHRPWLAAGLCGLAQATHPAVVGPLALLLVLSWWRWELDRPRLIRAYAVSIAIAAPAAWITVVSPVFADTPVVTTVLTFVATLIERAPVLFVPIALAAVRRNGLGWLRLPRLHHEIVAATAVLVAIILNVAFLRPLGTDDAWAALNRQPDQNLSEVIRSPQFTPGATYRILRHGDEKVGMYQLLRAGAHLDSELFPESFGRRSFSSLGRYTEFLARRKVDVVIAFDDYDRKWKTNEHRLLEELAGVGCDGLRVNVVKIHAGAHVDVYRIRPCPTAPA
jgi:hypothetical protein